MWRADMPGFLLVILVMTMFAGAALLLWAWLQTRSENVLGLGALAYLVIGAGTELIAARGVIPDSVSILLGNALMLCGAPMMGAGIRSFNGHPTSWWKVALVPSVWLAACAIPAFYDSFAIRVVSSSVLTTSVYFLAAYETLRPRDGLHSRIPLAGAMIVQGLMAALRVPGAILADP